ncbi:hypothetical protein CSUI_005444 [Cystoisospora suis]|uniref:Uncharacterized protein n=1 Tax=Cystoisospora suis TaxID=483139 RepID=A0A2C6KX25_9APIC|nr:hypothetical protein CSUI_005444 [Cystoisospora suis]
MRGEAYGELVPAPELRSKKPFSERSGSHTFHRRHTRLVSAGIFGALTEKSVLLMAATVRDHGKMKASVEGTGNKGSATEPVRRREQDESRVKLETKKEHAWRQCGW